MNPITKTMITALFFAPGLSMAQNNFVVKAKMSPTVKSVKVYLLYSASGKAVKDSALVSNGTFQFTGKVDGPVPAVLLLDHKGLGLKKLNEERQADYKNLYLDKGNIMVTAPELISKSKISGSKINELANAYDAYTNGPLKQSLSENSAAYANASEEQQKDTVFMNNLEAKYNAIMEQKAGLQEKFIKTNPDSYFSLVAIKDIAENEDVSKIEPLFNGLSTHLKISQMGKEIAKEIEISHLTSIGTMAMDFTQNDVNGKPVKLSDFRGQYVLVDFWASWCGPCRAENPNVVKAYNLFKDKNFTILGVSLDSPGGKEAWLKAIHDDGLTWTQVSDLQGWKNAASNLYGVRGIPANFLIDPQGKIVAKDLRGAALENKLQTLLK